MRPSTASAVAFVPHRVHQEIGHARFEGWGERRPLMSFMHTRACSTARGSYNMRGARTHGERERERGSDAPVAPVARIARVALAVVAACGAPSFAANIRLSRRRCAQHQAKGGLCEPLRVERRLERARAYRRDQPPRARQGRRDPRRRFTESDGRRCSRRAQGNGSARRSDRGWCRPCAYRHGCRTDVHGRC